MKEYVKPKMEFVELRVDERLATASPGQDYPDIQCSHSGDGYSCNDTKY